MAPELDGLGKFLTTRGTTLLVKGYAGAGKTTLALQLLRALAPDGKGAYISSRVSEVKLSRQLPGLVKVRSSDYSFRDVRLGTGSLVLGEILKLVGGRQRPKAIVLDTWDGLAKEMDERERLKAEKTLISIADSTETRMVFVSEEPGRTTMDYLVDGIVELTRSEAYERVFREVEIQKLRGTLIAQHRYLYTLYGGRFGEFVGYANPEGTGSGQRAPIEDRVDGPSRYISFGTKGLDEALTGIKRGTVFTLEYTEQVPYSAARSIELSAAANAVNLGRGVILDPLPGVGGKEMSALMRQAVGADALGKQFLVSMSSPRAMRIALGIMRDGGESTTLDEEMEGRRREVERVRSNSADGSVIHMTALSLLETASAGNTERLMEYLAQQVLEMTEAGSKDSMILLLQSNSTIRQGVLALSERHVRLFVKDRSVVLLGEKPATEAYVLEHEGGDPLTPVLTKIV